MGKFLFCLLFGSLLAQHTWAEDSLFFKADRYRSDLDSGVTLAEGNVQVRIGEQIVRADVMEFRSKESLIIATGNVDVEKGTLRIKAKKGIMNSKSGLGEFTDAVMRVTGEFSIEAHQLVQLDPRKYRATNAKYSSCLDCPQSWSLVGASIDLELEGFAEIHHALFQIRDTPIAYFPVFLWPVKTKRQSGFLLPEFAQSPDLGSQVNVPYFWVHGDHSDSTHEYRYMTKGGHRVWNQLRYRHSQRSFVDGEFSYTQNSAIADVPFNRYGYSLKGRSQINPQWTFRFEAEGSSDPIYATQFFDEFQGQQMHTLQNRASVSRTGRDSLFVVQGLINTDNLPQAGSQEAGLNQAPSVSYSMASLSLLQNLRLSWRGDLDSFSRRGPGFDDGSLWIREGERASLNMRLQAPVTFRYLDWIPSAKVRAQGYHFGERPSETAPSAGRLFSAFDQRIKSSFSRVYLVDGIGDLKALRHSVTPSLRWSWAPPDYRTAHPFFDDANAPRFDLFDPNSVDAAQLALGTVSEEQRLRPHHLLSMGLETRFVGRFGETQRTYSEFLSSYVTQDYSIMDQGEGNLQWGRLYFGAGGGYAGLSLATNATHDWATDSTDFRNEMSYKWSRYALRAVQVLGAGVEAYGAGASVTELGPVNVSADFTWNAVAGTLDSQSYGLSYTSPSKCWLFSIVVVQTPGGAGFSYAPLISIVFAESSKARSF